MRLRETRSLADESSVGHAGKEIKVKVNLCKDDADPLKNSANSAGMSGACLASEVMAICVSTVNGLCINVARFSKTSVLSAESVRWLIRSGC